MIKVNRTVSEFWLQVFDYQFFKIKLQPSLIDKSNQIDQLKILRTTASRTWVPREGLPECGREPWYGRGCLSRETGRRAGRRSDRPQELSETRIVI